MKTTMNYLHKSPWTSTTASLLLGTFFFLATGCSQESSCFNAQDDDPISFIGLAEENEYSSIGSTSQMTTGTNRSTSSLSSLMSMSSIYSVGSRIMRPFWYDGRQGSRLVRSIFFRKKYEDFGSKIEMAPSARPSLDYAISNEIIQTWNLEDNVKRELEWLNHTEKLKQEGYIERIISEERFDKATTLRDQLIQKYVAMQDAGGFMGVGDF